MRALDFAYRQIVSVPISQHGDEQCWVSAKTELCVKKKLHFGLFRPENLVPYVCWDSNMPFGKLHTVHHSSMKFSFVGCPSYDYPVNRFYHMRGSQKSLLLTIGSRNWTITYNYFSKHSPSQHTSEEIPLCRIPCLLSSAPCRNSSFCLINGLKLCSFLAFFKFWEQREV